MLITLIIFFAINIIFISCNKNKNIITFLYSALRKTENITTKYDNINLRFFTNQSEKTKIWYSNYIIENIKNLNLFSFPNFNCTYKIYGKIMILY